MSDLKRKFHIFTTRPKSESRAIAQEREGRCGRGMEREVESRAAPWTLSRDSKNVSEFRYTF